MAHCSFIGKARFTFEPVPPSPHRRKCGRGIGVVCGFSEVGLVVDYVMKLIKLIKSRYSKST